MLFFKNFVIFQLKQQISFIKDLINFEIDLNAITSQEVLNERVINRILTNCL